MPATELTRTAHALHAQHAAALAAAAPPERAALAAFRVAPFASDPAATLRAQPVYVVSLKPYGKTGLTYPFGWDERAGAASAHPAPGLHRWYDGPSATGNFVREADRLLRAVLREHDPGRDPRAVFNAYAYPFRAADAAQLRRFGLERVDGWDHHARWLAIVRPALVLCIGNGPEPSAYARFRRGFAGEGWSVSDELAVEAAPRTYVRRFRAAVPWRADPVTVVGVPHLSYVRAAQVTDAVLALTPGASPPAS